MFNRKPLNERKSPCPNDALLSFYAQRIASPKETQTIEKHLQTCPSCREVLMVSERIFLEQSNGGLTFTPAYLVGQAKNLVPERNAARCADVLIKFNSRLMRVLQHPMDTIRSREAAIGILSRGRPVSDAQSLILHRVLVAIRFEIEIVRQDNSFRITVQAKNHRTLKPVQALRFSLLQNAIELESHTSSSGEVVFDPVSEGVYAIAIHQARKYIGTISVQFTRV